jgi:cytochrome o ubiquinol oxidase subunit 1
MYRGRIRFSLPMMWTLAFMVTFTVGGMTGVMLAIPPVDFLLHNSLFLIAHFHNVIIGGVVFGFFAGFNFWFPKAMGFKLDEFWGKVSFWCWVIGYWLAFTPLYVLGLMGVSRRMSYFEDPSQQIWFQIALLGALFVGAGIVSFLVQIAVSIKNRDRLRDTTGDPWDARSLEWSTSSPPPPYNFAFTPIVHARDAWWDMKQRGAQRPTEGFNAIHMPRGTAAGMVLSGLATVCGFALIWHIWWLAGLSFVALITSAIVHTFNHDRDYHIPADEVAATEQARTQLLARR